MPKYRLLNLDRKEWIQLQSLREVPLADPSLLPYLLAESADANVSDEDYFGRWAGDDVHLVGSNKLWGEPRYSAPKGGNFGDDEGEDWDDITQEACAEAEDNLPSKEQAWNYAPEYG